MPARPRLHDLRAWRRPVWAFLFLPFALAYSPVASAQQWLVSPEIALGAQYSDNPRLVEGGDSADIIGGTLDLSAVIRRNTPNSSILIRPRVEIDGDSGDNNDDSEAFFLDFNGEKQGQRSNWRFKGNFRQQQVFRGEATSAEIDDEGIGDADQTGTGRTTVRRQREQWRLAPSFDFDMTERMSVKVNANYLDVQYDIQAPGEAVNYTNSRLAAAIVRRLTPDSNLEFGLFASSYEPDTLFRETESLGAKLRYSKSVSSVSRLFIEVGAQDSDVQTSADPQDDVSESSFNWHAGYTRWSERTTWRFDLGQTVSPSGSGSVVERNLYRAVMDHRLRPRWMFGVSLVVLNTESLNSQGLVTSNDRDYALVRTSLGFQMTRNWTIEGRYDFTQQDFADTPGDAQENEIRLSLIYSRPVPTS